MSDQTVQQKLRGAYGRGYHDAIAAIGKENDLSSNAKLATAEQALNGAAQKILEAVPLAEAWSPSQIYGELRRAGKNIGMDVVRGSLARLVDL